MSARHEEDLPEYKSRQAWSTPCIYLEDVLKHTKGIADSIPNVDEYNSFVFGSSLNVTKTITASVAKRGEVDGMQMSYWESRWSFDRRRFELYRGDYVVEEIDQIIKVLLRGGGNKHEDAHTMKGLDVRMKGTKDSMINMNMGLQDFAGAADSHHIHGVLRALTVDGRSHLRPLFTSNDLRVALHDMSSDSDFEEEHAFPGAQRAMRASRDEAAGRRAESEGGAGASSSGAPPPAD